MFWKRKKQKQQLEDFDDRLKKNSQILAEDHHDLVELRGQFKTIISKIEALELKIDLLMDKQQSLRNALQQALEPQKSND